MTHIIEELQKECLILPFRPDQASHNDTTVTTIAALVAVTVMHDDNMSAEEKLLEIIEKSGEAEVLDNEDAFSELGLQHSDEHRVTQIAANDNSHPVQLI
jgi:hypothetical protein